MNNKKRSKEINQSVKKWMENNPDGSVLQCSKDLEITWITANRHVSKIRQQSYKLTAQRHPLEQISIDGKINPEAFKKLFLDFVDVARTIGVPKELINKKVNQVILSTYNINIMSLFGLESDITNENLFDCFVSQQVFEDPQKTVQVADLIEKFKKWCEYYEFTLTENPKLIEVIYNKYKKLIFQDAGIFLVKGIALPGYEDK